MFDNGKFEELLSKKDCEGIKLYLQYIAYSDKPTEIYSAAKAAYFCVINTSIPFEFISEIKDSRYTEMLRRFLFSFMRNNPPGASRQRARKALATMGFLRAEPREASLNAIGWVFNEALYRYELTGKTNAFSKPAKLIMGAEDTYAFAPVIKLIEACEGKITSDLLNYLEREDYLKNKNIREFLRQAGRNIPEEDETPLQEETIVEENKIEEPSKPSDKDERAERIKADMLKKREQENLKKKSDENIVKTEENQTEEVKEVKAEELKAQENKTKELKTEEVKTEEDKAEEAKTEEAKTEELKTEELKTEEVKAEEVKTEELKTQEDKAEEVKNEELKAEEVKTEELKAEEAKTEELKTEELKTEEVKAEEANTEELKTEEVKAEETKTEELKAEEDKTKEVKTEEVKTEEDKTEELKAEEVKTEEVKTEEAKTEELKNEEVKTEEVKAEEVKTEEVKPQEVKTEEVKTEEVKTEELKAEEDKTEELKTKEVKAEEVKTEELKVEEVKAEEVKTEELKTEEVKTEEVKAEEVKTEEVKTEEVKTEEVKTEEAKTEEVKTEELKTEEVKTEEVKAEEVKTEEVKTEEVKTEEVKTEEAKTEEVKTEELKTQEVKTEEVKTEELKAEEVKAEEVKTEEVKTGEVKTEEVKTEELKAEEAKTEEVKTEESIDKSKQLLSSLTELRKSKNEISISDDKSNKPDAKEEKFSDTKDNTEKQETKAPDIEKIEEPVYIPRDKYDIPIKIAKDQKVKIELEKPKVSEEILAAAAAKILDIAPIKKKQETAKEKQSEKEKPEEVPYVPRDKYDIPIKIAKDQKVHIELEKPKVSEEILAAATAKILDIKPKNESTIKDTKQEENKEVITVDSPKISETKTTASSENIIKKPEDDKSEVFKIPAPKITEIKAENTTDNTIQKTEDNKSEIFTVPAPKLSDVQAENTVENSNNSKEKETISGNLKKIKETQEKDLAPDLTARTLEMILESIKNGTDRDMSALREDIRDYFSDGFIMKDMLRRELKVFMSDSELPEHVSKRAMDILPMLGKAKQKTSISSLLKTISELDDEAPSTEIKKPSAVKMPSIEEDLSYPVTDMLMNYLKTVGSFEMKTSMCSEMISTGLKYDEYSKLFDFGLLKSGRILFDKIIPAAKAVVFCKKYDYQKAIPKAKNILLFSFYYMICPDILKMEAFATLKQTGFINYQTADIYKKYALAFAKNALLNKTIGPAARSLSDQISIKNSPSSRDVNLSGKSTNSLIEDFTSLMIKETNSELFESAIDILHHVSYEDPVLLRAVSDFVQPVNYEKALEIAAGLTKRRNTWAASVLVDAASHDFEAIRHKAASLLGECGAYMNAEAKAQAVSSIIEKMDDCYDEDAQKCYLEAATKIEPIITAERLIRSCLMAGLTERKEKGNRLLEFLANMSSSDMSTLFSNISNLQSIYTYLSSFHKDSFTSEFANTFINLYRVKFVEVHGDEMWANLLSESENKFSELINNIWNIQF